MEKLKELLYRLRGDVPMNTLIRRGLKVGKNLKQMQGVIIDDSHPWLIEIGDDVTLAPRVHILAHDASTKTHIGYTKIGEVHIGNRVFIGAGSIILPGVSIEDDVIIGANSTVTRDVPAGMVVAGCPAKEICTTEEYLNKEKKRMETGHIYDESFTLRGNITVEKKKQQAMELSGGEIGYVE